MGVQKRTVSHFKGLFKTYEMRYSTSLYSYWISLHVHFKKAILLLLNDGICLLTLYKPQNKAEII